MCLNSSCGFAYLSVAKRDFVQRCVVQQNKPDAATHAFFPEKLCGTRPRTRLQLCGRLRLLLF
jgi:hypothetical protein